MDNDTTSSTDAPVEAAPPSPPPRVAVVIPAWNSAWCLRDAVGSVLAQTFRDFAIVMIDDGSTDGTSTLMESLLVENPQVRMAWMRQENSGSCAARNAGIDAVPSEFIYPLDADDQIAPTALEEFVAALDANPEAGFAYSDIQKFGDEHVVDLSEPWSIERIKIRNFVPVASLIRRSSYESVGGYRVEEKWSMDWGLWLSMAEAGIAGVYIPRALFRYRKHVGQWSNWKNAREREELTALAKKNRPGLFGGAK